LSRGGHARCHRRKEAGRMGIRPGITVLLLLGLVAGAAAAGGGTPTIPQELCGRLTIGGSPAPAGTVITATIGDTEYGSIQTTEAGKYGDPDRIEASRLLVKAPADLDGETITFLVDGVAARETLVFAPAVATALDLSVPGSGGTGNTGDPGNTGGSGTTGDPGAPVNPRESAAPTAAPEVQTGHASLATSAAGAVQKTVTVRTADETCAVAIREGTTARDAGGNPLGEVTVTRADPAGVPAAPPGTGVAIVLNCGPAGATFDPPAVLTYTLSGEEWAKIGSATPKVIWYNPETGKWQEIAATVDPATRTITAEVGHFSIYALAWTVPGTAEAQQTTSPGGTTPAGDELPWPFIGIGAVLLAGAMIGGLVYLGKKN
ncbi:MAG: hypothetical protein M0P22_11195, partial [Methanoculleus sp.]|nr:hypothetical protein [Methanoculleus sp.]